MPRFKYTGDDLRTLYTVDVDMQSELLIVGEPENGSYEWVIVTVGKVEKHSDCGYGITSIALRDGLIAYHGLPEAPTEAKKPRPNGCTCDTGKRCTVCIAKAEREYAGCEAT